MELRNVGKTGLRVSAMGLGCNNFGWTLEAGESERIIHRALDLGVTLFDTAPVYGTEPGASEAILGKALAGRRQDCVILTKFGVPNGGRSGFNTSRAGIMTEVEDSLRRLRTDYIDIYMLHWPDPTTPLQETLLALDDLVRSGKVRYIGCSNLPAWRLVEAMWLSRTEHLHAFMVSQNEYSLAQRDAETSLFPALEAYGLGFTAYAPLANGLLTGKFAAGKEAPADSRLARNTWNTGSRYLTDDKLALADRLGAFAAERGHTLLELALGWQLSNPLISSVIAGATSGEQVEANVAAGQTWRLSPDEMAEVDKLCHG